MAKRFRFRLDALLKVRRLREREVKRKVAAKHAEIARLDRLDEQATEEISRTQTVLRQRQQQEAFDPETLARGRAWVAHLRRWMVERQMLRTTLAKEFAQLQAELRTVRTQTRIIEKLRERRWDEYRRDRQRREQNEADELAQQLQLHDRETLGAQETVPVEF